MCLYGGYQLTGNEYEFEICDVSDRCDIIVYGYYVFNHNSDVNSYISETDKSKIR
jgi:hypothetical protein